MCHFTCAALLDFPGQSVLESVSSFRFSFSLYFYFKDHSFVLFLPFSVCSVAFTYGAFSVMKIESQFGN